MKRFFLSTLIILSLLVACQSDNSKKSLEEQAADSAAIADKSKTLVVPWTVELNDTTHLMEIKKNPDARMENLDYLDIVEKIAADRGLQVDAQRLDAAAEQWAMRRGGRSPRCARQFIDHVESALRRGKEW